MSILDRLRKGWNAFTSRDPTEEYITKRSPYGIGSYSYRPDRPRFTMGNERSIVTAIYNMISIDAASNEIRHVRVDENDRFKEHINSELDQCLTVSANIDQTGRALVQDIVMSLLDDGSVAVVPVDTTTNPNITDSYDILSLRTARIKQWYPDAVKVRVYNERTGKKQEIVLPKSMVAIIESPLYAVINEPNSVLQRLIRKLNILDAIDEQSGSGKLNLIIQLPYVIKSNARKEQAKERLQDIEDQLANSKYGVAYTDSSEKITQIGGNVENNLLSQIEYLTKMLYGQLGISQEIMDGSANDQQMQNYMNRTIEPILSAITDEMRRKFLTKTARTQGQTIKFFQKPFRLVPISSLADLVDKLSRNEVVSSNEFRQVLGFKPSDDPKADQLINSNMDQAKTGVSIPGQQIEGQPVEGEENQNGVNSGPDLEGMLSLPISQIE